jgi:hypothetical protein
MTNTDHTAVATKDRLWDLLNDAPDKMEFLAAAELVLSTVQLTQGMWVELSYCYKVVELAEAINDRCRSYLDHCQHAMTIKRIEKVRQDAWMVRSHFYHLQQARMDVAWPA